MPPDRRATVHGVKRISFQLSRQEAAQLSQLAARLGVSQAELVRESIRQGLARSATRRA
jgi:predicted DNA-binding protein